MLVNRRVMSGLLGFCLALAPTSVGAQAIWSGGSGNWDSANWSQGSGTDGQPGAGQSVTLPASTETITLATDLITNVGSFTSLSQQGGSLVIPPGGRARFSGGVRIAEGVDNLGAIMVGGELNVLGGLDVGYGEGNGTGSATGVLAIGEAAILTVGGNLDTWWDPGAQLSITGGQAQILVNGTFFLGSGATMTANINSDSFSTVNVRGNATFAGGNGTLDVNFVDGYFPAIGTSWRLFDASAIGGQIPVTLVPETPPGTWLSVHQSAGGEFGQVVTLDYHNTLDLRIDPETGQASIENPTSGGVPLEIDGYIIRSESGSLNSTGFTGLGQAGWLPGLPPSQSNGLLSESNLEGSLVVAPGASWPIGSIFQTTGRNDLEFEFRLAAGGSMRGTVQVSAGGVVGDFNANGVLDIGDIDDLTGQSASGENPPSYDLNNDALVNAADITLWVKDLFNGWMGDANLDGEFTSSDLVLVLASGTYETAIDSAWSTGDFNGDGRTTSADLVVALADGGYEAGPRAAVAAVPEPTSIVLLVAGIFSWALRRRS